MWAGFVGIFIWGSIAGLLGALLPQLRERAAITLSQSSWMFVALSSGLVLSSLVAGYLLDRFGKKVVLCTAVAAVVAALVLFEVFTGLAPMVLLAFILGAGGSATVTGGHALIADLNPEHRAASLNLLDVFFGIGAFVTPFAIVPLQARGGTAAVLFTLAALAAAGLVFLLMVRFPPSEGGHAIAAATPLSIATSPLFLVPALLVFLYVGTEQSVWDWQVTYFMRRLSMDNISAARVLSIFPIAIMLGRLVNNRLLMRISPMPVLLVSTIGATLCFMLALIATSASIAAGALLLAGLLMASIFPTTLGVVSSRFPAASGTALGFAITCGWLGSMAISPTFGFIAQRTDFARGYLVIVGSAAAMALTAVVLTRQAARGAATVRAPAPRLVQDR
jgi:fucose permease